MAPKWPKGKKVVIALDSFKGSLTAEEACAVVRDALREQDPDLDARTCPMADGGEGTTRAMLGARAGRWLPRRVMGPWPGRPVEAGFAWFEDERLAVVEMASAAGLTLLGPGERQPLITTTYGVGELIRAAADHGARRLLLAVGGSATVDGGAGAANALGWTFLDAAGTPLGPGGGELARLDRLVPPAGLRLPPIEALCDVTHPLCGPDGAARVFGPQKGATPDQVARLETGLNRLAKAVQRHLHIDVRHLPGGGAAGGLAAGAAAFMNARLAPGAPAVARAVRLPELLADASWVITGEGRLDATSLRGKVVSGVVELARRAGVRVAVLAGSVRLSPEACRAAGLDMALPCAGEDVPPEQAMAEATERLAAAARAWFAAA